VNRSEHGRVDLRDRARQRRIEACVPPRFVRERSTLERRADLRCSHSQAAVQRLRARCTVQVEICIAHDFRQRFTIPALRLGRRRQGEAASNRCECNVETRTSRAVKLGLQVSILGSS